MDDFIVETQRLVYGKPDEKGWWDLPEDVFTHIQSMFKHSLLTEVKLSYSDGVEMKFRKKKED